MKNVVRVLGIKRSDWLPIALCLLAAVTFWFFISMNDDYSIEVVHPIRIKYDANVYVPVSPVPKEIHFNTTATGWDLLQRTSFISSTPIELDLEDFKKRRYMSAVRLKPIVERQMRGIKINYIQDDTIWVNFEKKRNQKVALWVDVKKYLAEGELLEGEVKITPSEVEVFGPGSAMKKLPSRIQLELPTKNIRGEYEEEIDVSPDIDGITILKPEVIVSFKTNTLESESKELALTRLKFPKKKTIRLSSDNVTLVLYFKKENQDLCDQFKPELILDYSRLDEKKKTIKPQLRKVPDWVRSYTLEPSVIELKYGE